MRGMKKVLVTVCLLLVMAVSGCSAKSEYYIEEPDDSKFNIESCSELENSDVDLIKEFLPIVTQWYNSIDISGEQSIDFVTDEVDVLGKQLYESPVWTTYLNDFASGNAKDEDKEKFQQINKANAIYGKIAEIMMTSEMDVTLSEESEETMTISEEIWIELGDCIKEALEYYYE